MSISGGLGRRHGRQLRALRGIAMVAAVSAAMLGGIAVAATSASAVADNEGKVWVCHATSSDSNPYRIIHVDVSSTKLQGHKEHRDDPNKTWNDNTTFGGSEHEAGDPKPDIIGEVNAEFAPTECSESESVANASLTLVKEIKNGGPAKATDWTLDAEGTIEGTSSFAAGTTPVTNEVADGTYTLSETGGPSNYTPSLWSCSNAEGKGTTVTIGDDDTDVTCTITNTYSPLTSDTARLTLVKVVDGGDADARAWTLKAGTVISGSTGTDAATALVAAGTYGLSESGGPTGYTPGLWGCTGNSVSGQLGSQSVTMGASPVTCTITNTFVAPVVTEVETVQPATVPTKVVKGPATTEAPVVVTPVKVTQLAFTGAETLPLSLSGLLALLLGAGLILVSRRRATD